MSAQLQHTVTRLLVAVREGNPGALNDLFPVVYDELRRLAKQKRRRWVGDYTINTTALVHEAYLKLADRSRLDWTSRAHFYAVAAKAMRHILINYAESQRAQKRGGHVEKLSLEEEKVALHELIDLSGEQADMLVALGEALKRLEAENERQAQLVECKFFGGMTNKEAGEAMGISEATVKRDWAMAQAWLHREVQQELAKWMDGAAPGEA